MFGSKNKSKGLEKSIAHVQKALESIDESSAESSGKSQRRKRRRGSAVTVDYDLSDAAKSDWPTASQQPLEDPILRDLPLESARVSPEPLQGAQESVNPMALIQNFGIRPVPDGGISTDGSVPETSFSSGENLPGWTREDLRKAAERRRAFFRYSKGARKRDIGPSLEPLVPEEAMIGTFLLDRFFTLLQPQIGFLDPALHDIPYLRSKSAFLHTAILSSAANALCANGNDELQPLRYRLQTHVERLLLTVISCNAKSPEIVQALLVLSLWPQCPERNVDDRSGSLIALAINMALELGLDRPIRHPGAIEAQIRRDRDLTRTWLTCFIQDRSMAAFQGRAPSITMEFDMEYMQEWVRSPLRTPGDAMLVGFLELRAIERDVRTRLATASQAYMREGIRSGGKLLLERWVSNWCSPECRAKAPLTESIMRFLAMHVHLLFYTSYSDLYGDYSIRDSLIEVARESVEHVIYDIGPQARFLCRTVCAMASWAAVLLLEKAKDESVGLVRKMAIALAPRGNAGDSYGYPYFYGSFLLDLTLSAPDSTSSVPSTSAPLVEPSPDTILASLDLLGQSMDYGPVLEPPLNATNGDSMPLHDLWTNLLTSSVLGTNEASEPTAVSYARPPTGTGPVSDSTGAIRPPPVSGETQSDISRMFDFPIWEDPFAQPAADRNQNLATNPSMDWFFGTSILSDMYDTG
ncbi:hypothetical protein DB88DRAFT_357426 [Papiliotrema laurentii]|uniref:Xylanolytic transcriptional activator regulatory domain-containing protein n=1 Tax=Papiliotrema laurentii TaxID=5418 RepID=A0AAD9CXL1_PAPLA|nr:hypothetical protein DB88DRAFT_357426 [Papiliotrema laurentii]